MPATAEKWGERFRQFAELECRGLSSLYETLSLGVAGDAQLLEWIASVTGARAHPTLLFAAVHYLLLDGAHGADIARFYPNLDDAPPPPADAYPAFRAFVDRARDALQPLLATRVTQTNEVGRCTYLLPAFGLAAKRSRKPLWIIDVGASAGLNLLFDRYAYRYGDGAATGDTASEVRLRTELRGRPVVAMSFPEVAGRVGVDLMPIDLDDATATRWLEACTWPEHVERFRNLRAALDIARHERPRVVQGNAVDALPALIGAAAPDTALVLVNTNVMLYFSADERARFRQLLTEVGKSRDVFWIANEHPALLAQIGFAAPVAHLDQAGLPLVMSRLTNGKRDDRVLANVGPHARWLDWFDQTGA